MSASGVDPPTTASCASATTCEAISTNGVWRTDDAGASWHVQRRAGLQLLQVACSTSDACSVGTATGEVLTTVDGGRVWTTHAVPGWSGGRKGAAGFPQCAAPQPVTALACWAPSTCVAGTTGRDESEDGAPFPPGAIATTTDGGRSWSAKSLPGGVRIDGLACASPSDCWAVGETTAVLHPQPVLLRLG